MGFFQSVAPRPSTLVSTLFALALITFPPEAAAQIRINEILANPSGSDDGTERIEIYNAGPTPIDVTGWAIDDAATFDEPATRAWLPEDFDTDACSGSAIIGPGEYRLVKGRTPAAWVNNSGDDIYLITDRTSVPPPVVHQVTYGQSQVGMSWAAVPDGSSNFAWRTLTLCATNGGGGDVTEPATVTDLAAAPGDFPGEVRLSWTASGDDGMSGTASEYRFKVAYAAIDAVNFDSAADLERWTNEPLPAAAGSPEEWTVFGLSPDSTYYFALVVVDDANNESGISNSPNSAPEAGSLLDPDLGYNTYYGNLHSHTGYSDGVLTPADAYAYARFTAPTPLDFLAVTDHNHSGAGMQLADYSAGLAEAAAATVDGQFVAIYGQEWGLAASGHVNIFESEDLFGWEAGNYDVFVAEGDYSGLYSAILANPPASYPPMALFCHPGSDNFDDYLVTANGQSVVHLMALVNGPAQSTATDETDIGNTNFDAAFGEALMKGYRVSPTADQDNHHGNWGSSTQSRTGVLALEKTKSAIMDALAARRTFASMDHNANVEFSADGHPLGEAFTAAEGIRIAARVSDPDPGAAVTMIEVFRGTTGTSAATRVAFNEGNSEIQWRELDSFPDGTETHYYLRIRLVDGGSIWTGPVYVTHDPTIVAVPDIPPTAKLSLAPPYPNPARENVTIRFTVPRAVSQARLDIFDLSGRLVRTLMNRPLEAGVQTLSWDGLAGNGISVQAGIYFVRLKTDLGSASQKMIYLRQ
jgi:hypothetical protein